MIMRGLGALYKLSNGRQRISVTQTHLVIAIVGYLRLQNK